MQALMKNLSDRGRQVKSVLILGNLFQDQRLPLIPAASTPVPMVQSVYDHLRRSGLDTFIAGGRSQALWLRAMTQGPRQRTVTFENLVDDGAFTGEGDALDPEIPAITLGLPTAGQLRTSPSNLEQSDEAVFMKSSVDLRAKAVVSALLSLCGETPASWDPQASPSKGNLPVYGDMTVLVALGQMHMVKSKYLAWAGVAMGLLAAAAIVLSSPWLGNRGALGWVGGAILAALLALGVRAIVFRSALAGYVAWVYPERPTVILLAIFILLFTTGFLRLWTVRSRIANLPKAANCSTEGLAYGGGSSASGAWGLAVMGGVCTGMGLLGSENLGYSLLATAGLLASVLFEWSFRKKDAATPPSITWLSRLLYLTPLFPGIVWSASSCWFQNTAENIASALCLGVAVGCLLSSFGPPKPVSRRRLSLLNLGTVLTPMAIVALGLIAANWAVLLYPVSMCENYGFSSSVTVSATMPLGEIVLQKDQTTGDFPSGDLPMLNDKTGRLDMRFADKVDCPWAAIEAAADKDSRNTFYVSATLNKRPTFFGVEVRDMPSPRGDYHPFTLDNLDDLLNSLLHSLSGEDTVTYLDNKPHLNPRRGYRVRIIWWYPPEREIDASLVTTILGASRVEVTAQAAYLGESYLGLRLAKPDVQHTNCVTVTALPLYR